MWPGSLPASSTELYQEGLIIPPVLLTEEVLRLMLANMRHPHQRTEAPLRRTYTSSWERI